MKNDFESRKEKRTSRFKELAEKNEVASEQQLREDDGQNDSNDNELETTDNGPTGHDDICFSDADSGL